MTRNLPTPPPNSEASPRRHKLVTMFFGTLSPRSDLCIADAAAECRIYNHRGAHAGSRHRSQYCYFSVIDAVLLKPLPYADAQRLVAISQTDLQTQATGAPVSFTKFTQVRQQTQTLESVGALSTPWPSA